jgi:hypothetical protein
VKIASAFFKKFEKKQEKSSYQNTKGENIIQIFTLYIPILLTGSRVWARAGKKLLVIF